MKTSNNQIRYLLKINKNIKIVQNNSEVATAHPYSNGKWQLQQNRGHVVNCFNAVPLR